MMLKGILMAGLLIVTPMVAQAQSLKKAVFAGGCFWCVEADYEKLEGVKEAVSGFTGGTTRRPTYKSFGDHLEAVQVTYDADKVSYATLVDVLLRSVDVLDAGGQFCDRGNSYTTAIFANGSEAQIARDVIAKYNASGVLPRPIVTPVLPAGKFFKASAYHQGYYKSSKIVVTRRGPMSKARAYAFYRKGCGRDARLKQLWGSQAYLAQ
tara:strand:+ start:8349 stop:8975 length:627 start_codon:yes stop_codon:yes gene_type:complete